ncbi:hypothetical protein Rhe02_03150 [Rhizocola hellebori]|uniref:Uncharacterized protein n=1 Tax=Rhizocola hellebori TaxID=1392758 RepID=A0A8J3VDH0_9ACTN|nr:hypothetical protein [Rhizocola hellebori]GIH02248.1 hypothetical protein Rhe02_03150 [Rhizocola hellebori]
MSQTPAPALFRFVGVRRPAPPQPPLPPPDDDLIDKAFDFTDALLPVVAQVLQRDDRQLAMKLVRTLLSPLPKPLATLATRVRKLRRRAGVDDTLTLGDARPHLPPPGAGNGSPYRDLAQRAATVVVLVRWLGQATSPEMGRAAGLLRGLAIARLAQSRLDDRYIVADLTRGHTIQLPDVVRDTEPRPGLDTKRVQQDLRRLTGRAAALGRQSDPALDGLQGEGFADLAPAAERVTEAAQRYGLPSHSRSSSLARILDGEIVQGGTIDPDIFDTLPGGFPTTSLPPPALPVFDGRARVLGRGDLMVVRIEHLRYDFGEIAYVENVLKSELRGRTLIVDTRTSEKVVESSSSFSESTHELSTDERSELQDAASSTNTSTNAMSAGMNVAGGWGPVKVGIDLNASHSSTTTESNSSSSSYAKEVTDRATETMRSEASSKRVTTTRTRIAETNKHDFDNRAGADHIRGVYRWLEKVDRAQVFNYGERLLLEFVVPQPAAQFVYLANTSASEGEPEPVQALDFRPHDITEQNFVGYGLRYELSGLDRPPPAQIAVPATFSFPPTRTTKEVNPDPKKDPVPIMMGSGVTTGEVTIPSGYAAGTIIASVAHGGDFADTEPLPPNSGVPSAIVRQEPVQIAAGGQRFNIYLGDTEPAKVVELEARKTGNLPIAIGSQQIDGQAISMRVIAYRTDEAMKAWQHDTFERIQKAYQSKVSEYESALSVAQLRKGYTAVTPTDVNRAIEVRELTRGCQTILTGQDFTMFGSVDVTASAIPSIDLDEAWVEADAIQFFSDVMEWALMTYVFYPYQWAGQSQWAELSARTSPDPLHEAFLQAGAARVVVPVREGFEHMVGRYLKTGDIPEWGPEPWRGRVVHYPKVDELIADANDRPQGEVAVGEPWEVVSPTSLIYLQQDASLNLPSTEEVAAAIAAGPPPTPPPTTEAPPPIAEGEPTMQIMA